uniref:Uncharacterized protein n=1 Tax=Rhizophora mucronata TaxID=61149 RepID=A0A2P2NV36_RHIMU
MTYHEKRLGSRSRPRLPLFLTPSFEAKRRNQRVAPLASGFASLESRPLLSAYLCRRLEIAPYNS